MQSRDLKSQYLGSGGLIFETSFKNVFGRIWEDPVKKILRKSVHFQNFFGRI